jgi:hypothetical protein
LRNAAEIDQAPASVQPDLDGIGHKGWRTRGNPGLSLKLVDAARKRRGLDPGALPIPERNHGRLTGRHMGVEVSVYGTNREPGKRPSSEPLLELPMATVGSADTAATAWATSVIGAPQARQNCPEGTSAWQAGQRMAPYSLPPEGGSQRQGCCQSAVG